MNDPFEPTGLLVEQGTIQLRSKVKGIRIHPQVKRKQEIPYLTGTNMKKESGLPSASHTKIFQPSPHTSLQYPIQLSIKKSPQVIFLWVLISKLIRDQGLLWQEWIPQRSCDPQHRREPWSFIWTGYQHHCFSFFPANRTTESFYKCFVLFCSSSGFLLGSLLSLLKTASGSFSSMPDRLYLNDEKKQEKKAQ